TRSLLIPASSCQSARSLRDHGLQSPSRPLLRLFGPRLAAAARRESNAAHTSPSIRFHLPASGHKTSSTLLRILPAEPFVRRQCPLRNLRAPTRTCAVHRHRVTSPIPALRATAWHCAAQSSY